MPDPAPVPVVESGKGNSSSLVAAVAVAVIMLVGAAAIVKFMLPGLLADAIAKAQRNGPSAAASAEESPAGDKDGGSRASSGANFVISDILVNIAGTKAGRFLKATAYFDAPPAVVAELERKRPQITDIVSTTLGNKSLDELSDPGVRGKLRSELLATINPLLETKGEVTNIYFPEFIIQ